MTEILLQRLNPSRCSDRWLTNFALVDFLNRELRSETPQPIFPNFGEAINRAPSL